MRCGICGQEFSEFGKCIYHGRQYVTSSSETEQARAAHGGSAPTSVQLAQGLNELRGQQPQPPDYLAFGKACATVLRTDIFGLSKDHDKLSAMRDAARAHSIPLDGGGTP